MSSFRIRPRFKHLVPREKEEVENLLQNAVENTDVCVADFLTGHFYFKIPMTERHFWSPQLHVTTEQTEEGTIIRGLYGPNPTVWGIFFFGYVSLGLLFLGLGMWGLTQLNLGMDAGILWVLPFLVAGAIGLYVVAQFGQKVGAEQMYRLHLFYEEIFHDKVHIS